MGKNGKSNNGGSCLISTALIVLVLLYGGLTVHILNRGELSRNHDFNRSVLNPHGDEGDLDTHPNLQHHDLSSIFLEGLPPLRPSKKIITESEPGSSDTAAFDPNTIAIKSDRNPSLSISRDHMKNLRGRRKKD